MSDAIELAKAYVQIVPSAKGIKGNLKTAIEPQIKEVGEEGGNKLENALLKGLATAGKLAVAGIAATTVAVGVLAKKSVEAYSEYEQLVGGVQTLFGEISKTTDASTTVISNASNAWKTAGMDANTYMETATSFAASLMSSLKNDAEAAAKVADMAVTDMADNANKMGTPMQSIQDAYQGFAKQNYTMLDNLKLGYGGTKEEMQRLLSDAQKITGVKYDLNNLSDVYEAIHVVQKELGISGITAEEAAEAVKNGTMTEQEAFEAMGTTAKEASTTIQGSMAMTSAAWSNLVTGMGDNSADLNGLIGNFVEAAGVALQNMVPVISTALIGISTMVGQLVPAIGAQLPDLISSIVPTLLSTVASVVEILISSIAQAGPGLISAATEIMIQFSTQMISMLPSIIQTGMEMLVAFAQGIATAAPTLIPAITDVIVQMVQTLIGNIGILVDAGLQLMLGLAEGLLAALPQLIEALPQIIVSLVTGLLSAQTQIMQAGITLLLSLVQAIPQIVMALVDALPQIITGIITSLLEGLPDLILASIDLFMALIDAIPQIIPILINTIPLIITAIVQGLMDNWPKIKQAGSESLTKLIEGLSSKISDVASKTTEIGGVIKEKLEFIKDSVKQIGANIINHLKEGISSKISAVTSKISEIVTNMKNTLTNALSGITAIGSNLIIGLWNGIENKVSWITSKIKSFGSSVISAIKSIFGVHSPSVVFAEIGNYLAEGLAIGIDDGSGLAITSAEIMAGGVIAAVDGVEDNVSNMLGGQYNLNGTIQATESTTEDLGTVIEKSVERVLNGYTIKWDDRNLGRLVKRYV